jgi:hypothetical protein
MAINIYLTASGLSFGLISQVRAAALRVALVVQAALVKSTLSPRPYLNGLLWVV